MVMETNTVHDPRAMMIHSEHAAVAALAVMHAVRHEEITLLALARLPTRLKVEANIASGGFFLNFLRFAQLK